MGASDEPVGKSVGRRLREVTPLEDAAVLLETIAALLPPGISPKGVWRFKTFQEADAWALTQAAHNRAPRS